MDIDRFRDCADAYGGDLARWPADARAGAERFVAANPDTARGILADAAALDTALATWTVAPPDALFRARLRRAVRAAVDNAPYPRRVAIAQAAGVALFLFAGLWAGGYGPVDAEPDGFIDIALSAEEWE